MTIKRLNIKDFAEIKRVWSEAGLSTRPSGRDSYKNLKRQLNTENVIILGYESNGEIQGVVLLSHDERKGWINRLAVVPKYRRQGIASQLLKASENFFLGLGVEIFVTLVEAENETSIKCFEQNGYKYWDNIRYYSKRSRDDI